jgi:hypothetical protein
MKPNSQREIGISDKNGLIERNMNFRENPINGKEDDDSLMRSMEY